MSGCYSLVCLLDYQCEFLCQDMVYQHAVYLEVFLPSLPCTVPRWLTRCACICTAIYCLVYFVLAILDIAGFCIK